MYSPFFHTGLTGVQMSIIESIANLGASVRGKVILPAEEDYDESRTVWNDIIDRHPAVIVKCRGVGDVIAGVNFARDNDIPVSVHGRGHNISGSAVCDDGVMIDLSRMDYVHVDPDKKRAYVSPGASVGDFDREAQAFGLATPLATNSTTGISGLTLGGGFGWLTRKHGMTADNLISAEVVTAEGRLIKTSEKENSDLFWAIRGGGGNFGVVTMFEFDLHPVGPEVLTGVIVFPFSECEQILERYREFVDDMPDDMSVWFVARKAPPLPFLPDAVHGREVLILQVFYSGNIREGIGLVESLRSFGRPYGEHIGPVAYSQWQQWFDSLFSQGSRNYWKSHNLSEISNGFISTVIKHINQIPNEECALVTALLGGKAAAFSSDETAYCHRDAKFIMNIQGRWENPEEDQECIKWVNDFYQESSPHASGGVYVNFISDNDRIKEAYGSNYQKLVEVKRKYDPDNLFRSNLNIVP